MCPRLQCLWEKQLQKQQQVFSVEEKHICSQQLLHAPPLLAFLIFFLVRSDRKKLPVEQKMGTRVTSDWMMQPLDQKCHHKPRFRKLKDIMEFLTLLSPPPSLI